MALGAHVRVGIAIPQIFPDGRVDMALVREFVGRAEALGFDDLWTQERTVGSSAVLEPLGLLSHAAAITSRVRLGVAALILPQYEPVYLAKALGGLDHVSGGRLTVGLALGTNTLDYPAFGIPSERRVGRFMEGLRVMKALWTEPAARYESEFRRLDGTAMEPKPVQRPHPPLWFGGGHPNVLKRAVLHADGWMGAGLSSIADFKERAVQVRALLEEQGRDPATFTISKRVYLAVDDDAARAEKRLEQWFGGHYKSPALAARVSVWGSAGRVAEQVEEMAEAGATHLLLNPVFDQMEQLEALAGLAGLPR